ncbi:MAG: sodium/solute symporter [Saprospiraceae bacterium]|nr:sodium/solute symporter [Saprospiraceae bacterium]MDP5000038.1 sodium/solute symporter [Saprospiraceae bacterium]
MKKTLFITALFFGIQIPGWSTEGFTSASLSWENIASLPPTQGSDEAMGYAGMFAGKHEGVIILAGGANFPDQPPWAGGKKKWWDVVFVGKKGKNAWEWLNTGDFSLPKPLAYGASVSTPRGVLLLGGENEQGAQQDVTLIKWNPSTSKLETEILPQLPWPMSYLSATLINQTVYLAGQTANQANGLFLSMDLSKAQPEWQSLASWPGPPRTNAGLIAQSDGKSRKIYLFGGRNKAPNGVSDVFTDMYCFDPEKQQWQASTPLVLPGGQSFPLSAFSAFAIGSGHILVMGGVPPEPFNTLEKIGAILSGESTNGNLDRSALLATRDSMLTHHRGFSSSVYAYHTITQTWTKLEDAGAPLPVNAVFVPFEHSGLLVSGETTPGRRSPYVQEIRMESQHSFGALNYSILIGYLSVLVITGFWVSRKQHNTNDYFKAGGRVPWWAAGISIFGTQLSAITFMAIPAKTFATDWTLFFLLMTIIMVSPVIIAWFLPFFRRLDLTTAYEYLELRFNRTIRLIGSIFYIALQLGRLGIVLLLPSLALSVVTGIDVSICILIMGSLSILYTVLGGIEAVIWTDVIQVFVLLGGALVSLVVLLFSIDLDWNSFWALAAETGKTKIIDWDLDFTGTAIWVVLFGGLATNIVQYGSDQTVIQRYLTTKSESTAARGIKTGAWMALPSALIFFSMGTALYLFYLQYPQELSPVIPNTDSIFPWYIVTQLPDGVSGLLIAAIFAAAMSSLDSSMNSVATVITTDFFAGFQKITRTRLADLQFARITTVVIGAAGTVLALWMANMGIPSLWDQFNMLIGLFTGGLGGIFLSGILSKRTNAGGALIGFIGSAVIQVIVKFETPLSLHLYAFTGLTSALVLAMASSLLFAKPDPIKTTRLTLQSITSLKK